MNLQLLKDCGYRIIYGPDIACDGETPQRKDYKEVILLDHLRDAIDKLNPQIPKEAKQQAIKKILRAESQNLEANNQDFHNLLIKGVPVEYKTNKIKNDFVNIIDFNNPSNNEFLAINQFTIIENDNRRPDIILFINGLPLVIFELKNAADENATITNAYNQFQTYKDKIPSLFRFNEILIISDGAAAHAGTITSPIERFMPWKTINGEKYKTDETQTLIKGMLNKHTILDIIKNFIVFEKTKQDSSIKISKKLAAYHQYEATNKAIENTIKATKGDKRAGIVWHTQGSGKSLTMVFYTGKLSQTPELENPTVIVLTDRNDLDDQLFNTFSNCQDILRETPKHAQERNEIEKLLKVSSGGIIFTTIQKFLPEIKGDKYPLLSNRKNIIVIADEAHRSQYDFIDGFAKHLRDALPNASFIGFTGTPIEKSDRSTPAVFGKYVDKYDIEQAVEDKNTVPIYYESRLAKLDLKPEERPHIDKEFEEVTEGEEVARKEKLKSRWARVEAVVGSQDRIKRIATDIVEHYEKRQANFEGKGMIVCMSRRICIDLHNALIKLRPQWYNKDDKKGFLKVIMTGLASDPKDWQEHIRNKKKRQDMAERAKNPEDELKLFIVRDMWLTGFDVPNLNTMYIDKPMRGHGLMQAIARVNRVFTDKKGGLVVDYIGIASDLKDALATYTESGGRGKPFLDQELAAHLMIEKYEIVLNLLHGVDYKKFINLPLKDKLSSTPKIIDHIAAQEKGTERFIKHTKELLQAFALAVPHDKAMKIRDELGYFQIVRSQIIKYTVTSARQEEELDSAIKQIISKSIVSDRIIDIFAAAGLKSQNIGILSDKFLEEVKDMPQKNLAFEALKKLLIDQIRIISKKNIVQGKSFAEMLDRAIKSYTNKNIETAQIIEELVDLAKKMRQEENRGDTLKLTEDEIAFYDAIKLNDSAVKIMKDETLKDIARELVKTIRNSVSIDWTIRESVQAKLRLNVKKILKKYGYPPDKQQKATEIVLEQAGMVARDWAETPNTYT
ncbi:type I restriction endonuclease subunit R [Candidatus Woesearchaeota archaeon]|nr:type I restriction endonuclease subunit R [Candidatus Woesearchaeota archaeon]